MDEYSTSDLVECDICGRRFASDVLQRHYPICEKSSQKKRKVFDMSKKRAEGTELMQYKNNKKPASQTTNAIPVKKNNWKAKHLEFINAIRNARGVQHAIDNGLPLPPPPPPTINPDYVQCDYCGRRFKDSAAERHIPFCREQHQRKNPVRPNQNAAAKQATRTQYQPPKPVLKTQSQETFSGGGGGYGRNPPTSSNSTKLPPRGQQAAVKNNHPIQNSGNGRVGSGQMLRTGRTEETYTEARQLSASQRNTQIQARKFPSSDNINKSQYTGTGLAASNRHDSASKGTGGYHAASRGGGYQSTIGRGGPPATNQHKVTSPPGGQTSFAGRFCYDCGAKFPTPASKFCCECGAPKIAA